jgi:hypothetical protein
LARHLQIDADPDPVPDPADQFDADPDPDFYLMRIQVTKMMRNRADPNRSTTLPKTNEPEVRKKRFSGVESVSFMSSKA